MLARGLRVTGCAVALSGLLGSYGWGAAADPPQMSRSRIEAALGNIMASDRPHQDGLATVWDGDKYVQCRRMPDHLLRCEAAGALMQPSLGHVLVPERIARLAALGWRLDPIFGNYLQIFPADLPANQIADRISQALVDSYDADLANLEVQTDWIVSEPRPPRNGPSQNLAGIIDDAAGMAATAVHACAYTPPPSPAIRSAADLIDIYGSRVTGDIQRLRVNVNRRVYVVLDTSAGCVQRQPQTSPGAIYCEAQSADSCPILASVLTPEPVARLRAAGFADPGRAPNYWRIYPMNEIDDAAIAGELLTILYEVYGCASSPQLAVATEMGR